MSPRGAVTGVLVAAAVAVAGCGPHGYLKDYFRANGGFAYMNPPSSLEGPGTIVQFQHGGMLTVYDEDSAFKDVPVNQGDIQFADFDTSRQWRGSLSLAFDFIPETSDTGKLKAALVSAGAKTAAFRFGPVTKKVVELGKLVEAIRDGKVPPVALEFLKSRYCGVIAGVAEVSEMTFDFSENDEFQVNLDATALKELGSLTGGKFDFTTTGSKAFRIAFKDRPLYVGYYLWQPKFDKTGRISVATADLKSQVLYAPQVGRLMKATP